MDANTTTSPPLAGLLTIAEAADAVGIHRRHMENQIASGDGPEVTRIGRRVLIRTDKLAEWIDRKTEHAGPPDEHAEVESAVLTAVGYRIDGDQDAVWAQLRGPACDVAAKLLTAVDVIAALLKLDPDPQAALDALRERVNAADR